MLRHFTAAAAAVKGLQMGQAVKRCALYQENVEVLGYQQKRTCLLTQALSMLSLEVLIVIVILITPPIILTFTPRTTQARYLTAKHTNK